MNEDKPSINYQSARECSIDEQAREYDDYDDYDDYDYDDESGICSACNGSGEGYSEGATCSKCKGKGEV